MNVSSAAIRLKDGLTHFISRFHVLIYTLTVVIGVSLALLLVVGTVSSSDTDEIQVPQAITFDKETIERIEQFNTAASSDDTFSVPSGRINPLTE